MHFFFYMSNEQDLSKYLRNKPLLSSTADLLNSFSSKIIFVKFSTFMEAWAKNSITLADAFLR